LRSLANLLDVQQVWACLYPPTTIGSYYSGTLKVGNIITFTGALSHGNGDLPYYAAPRWEWYFDYANRNTSPDVNTTSAYPTWTYSQPGTYTVAVRYYDCKGWAGNLYTFQIVITEFKRFYFLKDHLGSVRMTVDEAGTVVGYDDYYPFGMQMDGRSYTSSNDARYKFTSKERDDYETGYDYFGARYYDSRIGRFLTIDPLADVGKLQSWSPYHYSFDNPMRFIDPSGLAGKESQEELERQANKNINAAGQHGQKAISLAKGTVTVSVGVGLGAKAEAKGPGVSAGVSVGGGVKVSANASEKTTVSSGVGVEGHVNVEGKANINVSAGTEGANVNVAIAGKTIVNGLNNQAAGGFTRCPAAECPGGVPSRGARQVASPAPPREKPPSANADQRRRSGSTEDDVQRCVAAVIAGRLHIERRSVQKRVDQLAKKFGVRGHAKRHKVVAFARIHGYIQHPAS